MESDSKSALGALYNFIFVLVVMIVFALINTQIDHKRHAEQKEARRWARAGRIQPDKHGMEKKTIEPKEEVIVAEEKKVKADVKDEVIQEEKPVEVKKGIDELSDHDYFASLLENYKEEVLAKLNRPESRSDVIVRYYTKPEDEQKVYSLRKYGFYIHEKPTDPAFEMYPSNTLYYGDEVSNEDIQLIAYVLIQSGVKLRNIVPSALHDDWKANSVEVGADSLIIEQPVLGLSDLRKDWH